MVVGFAPTTTTTLPIKEKWKNGNEATQNPDYLILHAKMSYQHLKQELSVHFICLVEN